jgi:hypothetical protein
MANSFASQLAVREMLPIARPDGAWAAVDLRGAVRQRRNVFCELATRYAYYNTRAMFSFLFSLPRITRRKRKNEANRN